ncbi:MAG: hypothetical protein ACWGNV_11225 [Bacteroidales bacterium]
MSSFNRLLWTGILLFVTLAVCEDQNRKTGVQDQDLQKTEVAALHEALLPDLHGDPPLPESWFLTSVPSLSTGIRASGMELYRHTASMVIYARIRSDYLDHRPGLLLRTGRHLQQMEVDNSAAAG